ncbi:MAG: hypothetical protein WD060_05265 [Pirellulales bacterium]
MGSDLAFDADDDGCTDIVWNKRSTSTNTTRIMNGSVRQATWAAIGDASRWSLIRRPGG